MEETRVCFRCKIEKPITDFYNGHNKSWCKKCNVEYKKQIYQTNEDARKKQIGYVKKYFSSHPKARERANKNFYEKYHNDSEFREHQLKLSRESKNRIKEKRMKIIDCLRQVLRDDGVLEENLEAEIKRILALPARATLPPIEELIEMGRKIRHQEKENGNEQ